MARITKTDLLDELNEARHELHAYQEVLFALHRGERPERVAAGKWAVWFIGRGRPCGPVVAISDVDDNRMPYSWQSFEGWAAKPSVQANPYLSWAAGQIRQVAYEAPAARVA